MKVVGIGVLGTALCTFKREKREVKREEGMRGLCSYEYEVAR
jgi:hypothetical protein